MEALEQIKNQLTNFHSHHMTRFDGFMIADFPEESQKSIKIYALGYKTQDMHKIISDKLEYIKDFYKNDFSRIETEITMLSVFYLPHNERILSIAGV